MDVRYKRLGKNTVIVFLGTAGSKIIGILMLPYYTYYLSKAEYGSYDMINTYSLILLAFFTCCIADSIFVIPKNRDESDKGKLLSSGFLFASFTLFAVVGISFVIRSFLPEGFVKDNIWWIIGLTYATFFSNYAQQFTRSIDKMKVYSMTGVIYVACIALFSFILLPTYKLDGYLVALILSSLVSFIFAVVFSKAYHYFSPSKIDFGALKELLVYGIPLIPNSIMWWIVDGINRPIMANEIGVEAIGLYAIANKVPGLLSMLFVVFSNAWGISMIEEFEKPDFNQFFNRTMKLLFFVVSLGAALLILCSKLIIKIIASEAFFDAWQYVPVLILGVIFQNMSSLVGGVFMAEKKSKYFFYSSLWGALTSLIMTLLLVKVLGLMGVCIAVALSFLCMTAFRIKYAWRYINTFNISYYIIMISIMVIQSSVFISINNFFLNLFVFAGCVSLMYLINRSEAQSIVLTIRNKIKK